MANIQTLPVGYLSDVTVGTSALEAGAVTGAKLSSASRTKVLTAQVGTIPTTGAVEVLLIAPFTGTIAGIRFTAKDALSTNNTNYITFSITNKGQAGAGSTAVLAATDANTTKVAGSALGAYTTRQLTNNGTAANLEVNQGDTLACTVTVTGTLGAAITQAAIQINVQVST